MVVAEQKVAPPELAAQADRTDLPEIAVAAVLPAAKAEPTVNQGFNLDPAAIDRVQAVAEVAETAETLGDCQVSTPPVVVVVEVVLVLHQPLAQYSTAAELHPAILETR